MHDNFKEVSKSLMYFAFNDECYFEEVNLALNLVLK